MLASLNELLIPVWRPLSGVMMKILTPGGFIAQQEQGGVCPISCDECGKDYLLMNLHNYDAPTERAP